MEVASAKKSKKERRSFALTLRRQRSKSATSRAIVPLLMFATQSKKKEADVATDSSGDKDAATARNESVINHSNLSGRSLTLGTSAGSMAGMQTPQRASTVANTELNTKDRRGFWDFVRRRRKGGEKPQSTSKVRRRRSTPMLTPQQAVPADAVHILTEMPPLPRSISGYSYDSPPPTPPTARSTVPATPIVYHNDKIRDNLLEHSPILARLRQISPDATPDVPPPAHSPPPRCAVPPPLPIRAEQQEPFPESPSVVKHAIPISPVSSVGSEVENLCDSVVVVDKRQHSRKMQLLRQSSDDTPVQVPLFGSVTRSFGPTDFGPITEESYQDDTDLEQLGDDAACLVLREFILTERNFVRQLRVCVELLLVPVVAFCQRRAKSSECAHVVALFHSLKLILSLNATFVQRLDELVAQPGDDPCVRATRIFVEFAPNLRLYASYGASHTPAQAQLSRLLERLPALGRLLADVMHTEGLTTPLDSFLIMPVQRLPRYMLLLQQMRKQWRKRRQQLPPELHTEIFDKAVNAADRAARIVDDYIRTARARDAVTKLDTLLTDMPSEVSLPLSNGQRELHQRDTLTLLLSTGKELELEFFLLCDLLIAACPGSKKLKVHYALPLERATEVRLVPKFVDLRPAFELRVSCTTALAEDTSTQDAGVPSGSGSVESFVCVAKNAAQRDTWVQLLSVRITACA